MTLWSDLHDHRGKLVHKWAQYFPAYERHFARFRDTAVTVVEIGVSGGGSLELWRRYFGPLARLVGVDIDPGCAAHQGYNTIVRIGSQTDEAFMDAVMREVGPVQIVIDDGSHIMAHVRRTFDLLYHHPMMDPNGLYVVEDLHTAYLPEYGGGVGHPGNFLDYAKTQVDALHAAHTRGRIAPTRFTAATLSMHFYDSLLIYERGRRPRNVSFMADAEGTRAVEIVYRAAGEDTRGGGGSD